ncbi:MAG: SIS domain-containing protein [bacterium]|nr:SIS domain-containing protein [bacterium]
MFHIEREIAQQPEVVACLLKEQTHMAQKIAAAIRTFNPVFVCIAARGTSDNAGRYAQYLMGIEARLPVMLATPSVHTLYQAPPDLSRALVIGISQSGRSEDIFQVISDARQQGALTLSITNNPESRIAQAAEYHLDLMAGEEISIAATKTYTAQLTAVAMLVAALMDKPVLQEALATLPEAVRQTLSLSEVIAERTERYRYMNHFVTLGRGYNYCTAFEISLKVKELCYIVSEQYSEADFRHGPIAIVHAGFPVMVVAPSGAPLNGLLDLLEKLHERKAECLVISNDEQALQFAQTPLRLPAQPEWLTPVTAVIPGQLFAMNLALLKGHQVDRPEGLTKVTNTI